MLYNKDVGGHVTSCMGGVIVKVHPSIGLSLEYNVDFSIFDSDFKSESFLHTFMAGLHFSF